MPTDPRAVIEKLRAERAKANADLEKAKIDAAAQIRQAVVKARSEIAQAAEESREAQAEGGVRGDEMPFTNVNPREPTNNVSQTAFDGLNEAVQGRSPQGAAQGGSAAQQLLARSGRSPTAGGALQEAQEQGASPTAPPLLTSQQTQTTERTRNLGPAGVRLPTRETRTSTTVEPNVLSARDALEIRMAQGELRNKRQQVALDRLAEVAVWNDSDDARSLIASQVGRMSPEMLEEFAIRVAAEQAELEKEIREGPLEEVFDPKSPTGTRFMRRSEAAGKAGPPGQGLEFEVTPEGGVSLRQGRGAGGAKTGAESLSAKTVGRLEDEIINAAERMDRLRRIETFVDSSFLTRPTRAKIATLRQIVKTFGSQSIGPEQKELLDRFARFSQIVGRELDEYIVDITGAQMSEQEAKRLKKSIPNLDDDSVTFMAKFDEIKRELELSVARLHHLRNQGIKGQSLSDLFGKVSLRDTEAAMQRFSRRAAKSIRRSNPNLAQDEIERRATEMTLREFGLR